VFRRFGPQALVALLIMSTGVAFAVTEHLKLERSPIARTVVTKRFSPVCGCATARAEIAFTLRKSDRVTITILESGSDVEIRRLFDQASPAGRLRVSWDGRDESGSLAPDGSYRVRVHLPTARRTINLPNVIRLDTEPPEITLVSARPRTFSPDDDHRADALHIRFKLSEKGYALLYVDGRFAVRAQMKARKIDWKGKLRHRLRLGVHELTLRAIDRAGNESKPTAPFKVRVRILELASRRIGVAVGKQFSVFVSTDRRLVRWRFAGAAGIVRHKRLFLTAPLVPGQYWLILSSGQYVAGARVFAFVP
jgi:hypothetical protein